MSNSKETRLRQRLERMGARLSMVISSSDNRPLFCPQTLEETQLAKKVDELMHKTLLAQQELTRYRVRATLEQNIIYAMWSWFK